MNQTKVMSVFDGHEMQKYFLYLTKEAQEAAHNAMESSMGVDIEMDEFLNQIKNMPQLKHMIQEMILYSIANIDWSNSIQMTLGNNVL